MKFVNLDRKYKQRVLEYTDAYHRVMDSGYYILGPEVEAFEKEFAGYCGTRNCVGLASGLDALILSLKALGIGPGDEVIVPANTYIATWIAVSRVGAVPIPVEPMGDFTIDVNRIEDAIDKKTKAIIPVHLFGTPADMIDIEQIAGLYKLYIVSDCAQAHGAKYDNKNIGSWNYINAFSFYPTKPLGSIGDGGAITTNNDLLAQRIRQLRCYGEKRKYYNVEIGYNSRLDELQAAFLRVGLNFLDTDNGKRRGIALRYYEGLKDSGVRLPIMSNEGFAVYHQFVICHPKRDELRDHLANKRVPTLIHYPQPPHLSKAYEHLGYDHGDFPITEAFCETMVSLPIDPFMSNGEVDQVIDAVRSFK